MIENDMGDGCGGDKFHRDFLVELAVGTNGGKDFGHTACANLCEDCIVADLTARHAAGGIWLHDLLRQLSVVVGEAENM